MDPNKVTSRSNSDLCSINMIAEDTYLDPTERMALIAEVVRGWNESVGTSAPARRVRQTTSLRDYWKERAA